ncbi:MAG: hypothetical protein II093_06125, partial [Selenomonas sp.]|nr:hypothetical protein [Selenomonas sp.]
MARAEMYEIVNKDKGILGAYDFPPYAQACFAHFLCALALADLGSTKSKVFLSFRTGPKRTLGP